MEIWKYTCSSPGYSYLGAGEVGVVEASWVAYIIIISNKQSAPRNIGEGT